MPRTGRPATGQTPVVGFRPPVPLREEAEALARAEGRKLSDALIEALHDWVAKKRRQSPDRPGTGGEQPAPVARPGGAPGSPTACNPD
jgi:hypothetical protein